MPAARTQKKQKPTATTSAIGAPAQYAQTNRKGKKAWRKNIDIQNEEAALQRKREVETALGPGADSSAGAAFVVDVEGDAESEFSSGFESENCHANLLLCSPP
jgi:nucleolar protein 53